MTGHGCAPTAAPGISPPLRASATAAPARAVNYLSTLSFGDDFLDRLGAVAPGLQVRQLPVDRAQDVPAKVWAEVEVLHTSTVLPPPGAAPRLRWIQLDTSGSDHLRDHPLWDSDVAVTTLGGVGPVSMAEYVLFAVLGMAHRLPGLLAARTERRWPADRAAVHAFTPLPVRGSTLSILGYGRIGQEIARLAAPFGIRVLGVTRSGAAAPDAGSHRYDGRHVTGRPGALVARLGGDPPLQPADDCVVVVGPNRLDEVLAITDWLVVVLPRTPDTLRLLDRSRLRRLRRGAVLINVSRGGIVDEAALLDCLREGRLGGAVLDVFDAEPLTPESVWWREPQVVCTPHVAGLTPDYAAHVEHLVTENLRRYLSGAPLMNLVDRTRGY